MNHYETSLVRIIDKLVAVYADHDECVRDLHVIKGLIDKATIVEANELIANNELYLLTCPKCMKQLTKQVRYCPQCGQRVHVRTEEERKLKDKLGTIEFIRRGK